MKTSTALLPLSLALMAVATPLGNRAVFKKHNGVPHVGARRFILESRVDSPPACVAKSVPSTAPSSNTTTAPDLSGTALPLANASLTDNSTTAVNGTGSAAGNSTVVDPTTVDNSTTIDNSTSTDNSTTARRSALFARIAQTDLPIMAQKWQDLCLASGGDILAADDPCVFLAGIGGVNALLVDADVCDQQDIADSMITFAKTPGVTNRDALIKQAIAYRRHPRNAVNILGVIPSTPYCTKAPINPELNGIVNSQVAGVAPGLFGSPSTPIVPFGASGTCPFGSTPDISTCTCTDTSDPSLNGTDTSTGNSTDTSSATNATSTDVATDSSVASATDSAASSTATATDVSSTDTSSATATDSAAATDSTDTSVASATDSAAASVSTDTSVASATDSASSTDTAASAPPAATDASGPNFQPSDISGDVNDTQG